MASKQVLERRGERLSRLSTEIADMANEARRHGLDGAASKLDEAYSRVQSAGSIYLDAPGT